MIGCPCGFESPAAPDSPQWHRDHREHHIAKYPGADVSTRAALDRMVTYAEEGKIRRLPSAQTAEAAPSVVQLMVNIALGASNNDIVSALALFATAVETLATAAGNAELMLAVAESLQAHHAAMLRRSSKAVQS